MVSEEDKVGDSANFFFFFNLSKLAIFRAYVCRGT